MTVMTFAQKLKAARIRTGISQRDLARRAGLAETHVGTMETGRQISVQIETLRKLATALGISPADLLPDPDDSGPQEAAE